MGAGASIPDTEEEALTLGYTREEIDAYLCAHPQARRGAAEMCEGRGALAHIDHSSAAGKDAEKKAAGLQELTDFEALFDECEGDFVRLAARVPHADAAKMRAHVEGKVREFNAAKASGQFDYPPSYDIYGEPRRIFALGQVEGLFY